MKKLLPGVLMLGLMIPAFAAADEHVAAPEQESEPVVEPDTTPPPPPPAVEKVVVETEKARPFLDNVNWLLMASGYYMFNVHRVNGPYNAIGYPYTNTHGFGLNFAGADMNYMTDTWGITLDIRFGSGAGAPFTPASSLQAGLTPLAPIKQAYASWMPLEKLSLDMGFFDTIFGAEVVNEWENVNFTRGALYFLRQPFNHMGLRIGYAASDKVGLTFLVTNGGVLGGTPIDGNEVPAFGWQVSLAPLDDLAVIIGANHAPNGTNGNKDWEHFIDIVITYNFDDVALIFNADFTISPDGPVTGTELEILYGFSLAGLYSINEHWSVGLRGEFLDGNNDANPGGFLATITPTVRYMPIENLIISLEPRVEIADAPIFFSRDRFVNGGVPNEDIYFGAILGVTAKIGN